MNKILEIKPASIVFDGFFGWIATIKRNNKIIKQIESPMTLEDKKNNWNVSKSLNKLLKRIRNEK